MIHTRTTGRLLPPGGTFQAVVAGKPTGLAGCACTASCRRASTCLRADQRLQLRWDHSYGRNVGHCRAFVLREDAAGVNSGTNPPFAGVASPTR